MHPDVIKAALDTQRPAQTVAEAAVLLDRKFPYGWADWVDLDTLDLMSPTRCILGQLFGDWDRGAHLLFGSWASSPEVDVALFADRRFTEEWKAAIQARRRKETGR